MITTIICMIVGFTIGYFLEQAFKNQVDFDLLKPLILLIKNEVNG